VRVDDAGSLAYAGPGMSVIQALRLSPQQLFLPYHADDLQSTEPIAPFSSMLLKSLQTGLWCHLVLVPDDATETGMVCDLTDPAAAIVFTYTGRSISYESSALVVRGRAGALLLLDTTDSGLFGPGSVIPQQVAPGEGLQQGAVCGCSRVYVAAVCAVCVAVAGGSR
jgi:hypothetical protein